MFFNDLSALELIAGSSEGILIVIGYMLYRVERRLYKVELKMFGNNGHV